MSQAPTITVTLEVTLGADPIKGSMRIDDGPSRSFRGWQQLTALLQDAAVGRGADPGSSLGAAPKLA